MTADVIAGDAASPPIAWRFILIVASVAALLTVVLFDTIGIFVLVFPLIAAPLVVGLNARRRGMRNVAVEGAWALGLSLLLYPAALLLVLLVVGIFWGL